MKGKKIFTIILIGIICVVGYNVINDDTTNTNNNTGTGGANYQSSDTTQNNEYYQNSLVPYTVTKSGYLVDNGYATFTYSLSEINTLNGFFVLTSDSNVTGVPKTTYGGYYGSTDKNLCKSDSLPVCLDRSKGDKLIVVGSEWEGRSRYDKQHMIIDIFNLELLGYGDMYTFADFDTDKMDNVNGISISQINDDENAITQALSGSGITCVKEDFGSLEDRYLLSSQYNAPVTCGFYEGTEYKTVSANLANPFIVADEDNPIELSVQTTSNGYFIVDVSGLPAGMYAIDSLSGYDIIVIE